MKKQHITTAAAIVFALGVASTGFASAHSYKDEGLAPSSDTHDAVEAAIEAGDYTAFVEAVGAKNRILKDITPETFTSIQKIHDLREAGSFEEANALAEELGIKGSLAGPKMHTNGMMHRPGNVHDATVKAAIDAEDYTAYIKATDAVNNKHVLTETQFAELISRKKEMKAKKIMIDAAIDARDYEAFVQALGDNDRLLEQVNESNFAQFAELHDLREAGDTEAARALAKELGLKGDMQRNMTPSSAFRGGPRMMKRMPHADTKA